MSHGALLEKAGGQDRTEGAEKPAGPSATMDPGEDYGVLLGHPATWLVTFLRESSWDSTVSIPHKDWKPAEEQGSVLGNATFHQDLGPDTHQGGLSAWSTFFTNGPGRARRIHSMWEKGPNLIFWQGASQWALVRYPVEYAP